MTVYVANEVACCRACSLYVYMTLTRAGGDDRLEMSDTLWKGSVEECSARLSICCGKKPSRALAVEHARRCFDHLTSKFLLLGN